MALLAHTWARIGVGGLATLAGGLAVGALATGHVGSLLVLGGVLLIIGAAGVGVHDPDPGAG